MISLNEKYSLLLALIKNRFGFPLVFLFQNNLLRIKIVTDILDQFVQPLLMTLIFSIFFRASFFINSEWATHALQA